MITTRQAAEAIGASEVTVRRLCRDNSLGSLLHKRQRVLTADDVERLRELFRGRPGCPDFGDPDRQREFLAKRKSKVDGVK